jgi:hypothetical protein
MHSVTSVKELYHAVYYVAAIFCWSQGRHFSAPVFFEKTKIIQIKFGKNQFFEDKLEVVIVFFKARTIFYPIKNIKSFFFSEIYGTNFIARTGGEAKYFDDLAPEPEPPKINRHRNTAGYSTSEEGPPVYSSLNTTCSVGEIKISKELQLHMHLVNFSRENVNLMNIRKPFNSDAVL